MLVAWVLTTSCWAAVSQKALLDALRGGGHVLLLRHAQTVPGVGDPPEFKLNDCATQRNLSPEGRAQAKRIGEALKAERVVFARTLTSQWCRCRDTATLISDNVADFPAINSFFNERGTEPRQSREVRAKLKTVPRSESWLLVTHQVNITSLTGANPAMGEGIVVRVTDGQWQVLGTLTVQ
ncbi:MAG: histidine phosphatase family protein [Casimicrobium sp.]